ncbi:MAG: macro domain-containing protein [Gemmatimonadota bacterium]|jgi:O-acetyl-ADP-ribose deacetylase (regulator of RNase III)
MIEVVLADMATLSVQGLVRAVSSDMSPADAQARDLVAAAGPELVERMGRLGMLPVGGAVLTPGGGLAAPYLIHVVVMSHDEPQSSLSIQRALRNGLRRAADWGLESLAVPALGLGAGSLDAETAARVLVDILFNHLDEGAPPLELTIAVSSEFEVQLFEQLIAEAGRMRSSVGD